MLPRFSTCSSCGDIGKTLAFLRSSSSLNTHLSRNKSYKTGYKPKKAVDTKKERVYQWKAGPSTSRSHLVNSARVNALSNDHKLDYLLVLDFEATCEDGMPLTPCQEIIEMPVIVLNCRTWQTEGTFHQYIRPVERPVLTPFCTHLTGIIQEMVDEQPTLQETLTQFDLWLKERELSQEKFSFVTCGDWDLSIVLPREAEFKNIPLPSYFSNWINVKKSYAEHTGQFAKGLKDLLRIFKLQHKGRLHSGIDDVENICAIVRELGKEGYAFRQNGSTVSSIPNRRLFKNQAVL